MMHIVQMIERRHPEHAGRVTRALFAGSGLALAAGGALLLLR